MKDLGSINWVFAKIGEVFIEKVPGLDGLKVVKIAARANGVVIARVGVTWSAWLGEYL